MSSVPSQNNLKDVAEFIQNRATQECLWSSKEFRQKEFFGQKSNWAQEMIGTDLVKERIRKLKISSIYPVLVGMVDVGFFGPKESEADCLEGRCHGMKSRMLMAQDEKYGIGSFASTTLFDPTDNRFGKIDADDGELIKKMKDASIINFSFYHPLFHMYGNSVKDEPNALSHSSQIIKLIQDKTFVISSGNARSENGEAHEDKVLMRHDNAIVVGAVSGRGLPASFTNKSDAVTVMAPGVELKAASDLIYLGTSASAPIVSGVLSDLEALLGPLSGLEQKTLIRHTSITLPINVLEPGLHGAGLINHYKAFRAAERIQKDPKWPTDKSLLNKNEFYNFDQEAADLEQQAIKEMKTLKCENVQKAAHLLRQSFLLKPSELNRYLLHKIYSAAGLNDTANFYGMAATQDIKKLGSSQAQIGMMREPDMARVLARHPELLNWEFKMRNSVMNVLVPEGKGGMGSYSEATNLKASPILPSDPKPQGQ